MLDMSRWSTGVIAAAMVLCAAAPVVSSEAEVRDGAVLYSSRDSFEDVSFAVETAIVDRGMALDSIIHLGKALERERSESGSGHALFRDADVFGFCPASAARPAIKENVLNIRFCPYSIFIFTRAEDPGVTHVGFTDYPEEAMREVRGLLEAIVRDALELD